jgi:hypothetical protein
MCGFYSFSVMSLYTHGYTTAAGQAQPDWFAMLTTSTRCTRSIFVFLVHYAHYVCSLYLCIIGSLHSLYLLAALTELPPAQRAGGVTGWGSWLCGNLLLNWRSLQGWLRGKDKQGWVAGCAGLEGLFAGDKEGHGQDEETLGTRSSVLVQDITSPL